MISTGRPVKIWCGEMLLKTVNKFSLSLGPSASDSPVNTKSESQIPRSSWTEQQPRTVRPVGGQPFTQHTGKFVIGDHDMDSDTATESNLSLKSRSFLHRVNDRLRKKLTSLQRTQERHRQTFLFNLVNVYVFNIGSICIHGKE